MSSEERSEILKVLSGAILRETNAFNYYYRGSEDPAMPPAVRGLLSRLAEEERRHRHLLIQEYLAVKRGWREGKGDRKDQALSYTIPKKLTFIPLEVSSNLEAVALSLPSRLVGGDNVFASVIRDRSGRETGTILFLYDVMGHSIETTEINAMAARTVGEYFETSSSAKMQMELLSPKKIVRLLNKRLNERFEGQGIFLTMLCTLFDLENETVTYTCAGHEPPFLVHENGHVGSLLHTQLIVGIDPDFPYREYKVPFDRGDVLCIFSDGIVEARDKNDNMFGRGGVADVLEGSWRKPLEDIVRELLNGVERHGSGAPIEDEVSIIVVRSKGA